jgi:hypothetical protein
MRSWVRYRHWQRFGEPMPSGEVRDAIETLASQGEFGPTVHPVHLRVASHVGALFLDLANSRGQVVEITAGGWEVVTDPPVRFVRPPGMRPLPVPVRGGTIEDLRPFLNITDQDSWVLFVGALLAAFSPTGPHFILVLQGEQASAKSTTARVFRRLVDPARSPLRAPPRNQRDLLVAAKHSWIVCLDNISLISDRLSDALCRLSTGGGFSTRTLYTDQDEIVLDACRPVVLTGIADLATRGDLRDRAITLDMEPIAAERRRTEADLWVAFEKVRPMILGAICDALACALRQVDEVSVDQLPRMADAARWISAAEVALAWTPGTFAAAYTRNRRESLAQARDDSPLVGPILALIESGPWSGPANELLARLGELASAAERADPDWPKTPRKLTAELKRLNPALRDAGLEWLRLRRTGTARLHRITRLEAASSPADAVTTTDTSGAVVPDDGDAEDDGSEASGSNRHPASGVK